METAEAKKAAVEEAKKEAMGRVGAGKVVAATDWVAVEVETSAGCRLVTLEAAG